MDWSATMLALGGAQPAQLDGVSLLSTLRNPAHSFARPMFWRMKHRNQRAVREGDWKYLCVDGNEYLFNIARDERERANQARREPERLAALRAAWNAWNATMPAVPEEAMVNLGYGAKDMPGR
jgi:arylsulfatase A-like enzyme